MEFVRVKCINDDEGEHPEGIVSKNFLDALDGCPICDGAYEVIETTESELVDVMTQPEMQTFTGGNTQ